MPHPRKALRDAAVAGVSGSSAIAALVPVPTVEASRVPPLDPQKLPRILVYIRGETSEDFITTSPREYAVTADLVVEYVARYKLDAKIPEDELDVAAEAIESALDSLETTRFGGLARQVRYRSTDVAVDLDGSRTTASIVFRYEIEYGREVAPTLSNAFTNADVAHGLGDTTAENPTDTVALPQ